MKITIIGSGYVGLVTGACLADLGHTIVCVDSDQEKITKLQSGVNPIYEPGLDDLLHKNIRMERLSFVNKIESAVENAEVVFITVGTPQSRRGIGYADMGYVHAAVRSVAKSLNGYTVIVNKSTVPIGTATQVERIVQETNPGADFDLVSNPEFLREGAAIYDFMHPDRIVIGARGDRAEQVMRMVYQSLFLLETPFVVTNFETAELIKYASNAFLAMKVSFINEMANLCESVGAEVQDLSYALGLDKRIGRKFLHAGPGFGGSCFPKDTMALARMAQEHGAPSRIIETVIEVNNAQKARMVRKIQDALMGNVDGKILAVLGLTFKPETDDMRDAPALTILPALIERGVKVRAHDPAGMEESKKVMQEIDYCSDPYRACEGADAVCLMTEWNPYRALDLQRIKSLLREPVFVDLRNVYKAKDLIDIGFKYVGVGQKLPT
jgi:UDPglucose 6-dehydrogenase